MSLQTDSLRDFQSSVSAARGVAVTAITLYVAAMASLLLVLLFGGR